jgi:hypothetical protein
MFFSEYHFGKPPCVIGRRVKKKERAEDGGFISTLTPQESGKHHVAGSQGF